MATLLQEIKEELKEESWWAFVSTYAPYAGAFIFIAFLILGGWFWHTHHVRRRLEGYSAFYESGVKSLAAEQFQKAQKVFLTLGQKEKAQGYRLLSRMAMNTLARKKFLLTYDPEWLKYLEQSSTAFSNDLRASHELVLLSLLQVSTAYTLVGRKLFSEQEKEVILSFQTPQSPWYGLSSEIILLNRLEAFAGKEFAERGAKAKVWSEMNTDLLKALKSSFVAPSIRTRLELLGIAAGLKLTS